MVRVKDPRRLLKMIARLIDHEISVKHTSILMYEQAKNRYIFVDSKGEKKIPVGLIRLDSQNPLIQWFAQREKIHGIARDSLSYKQVCHILFFWLHHIRPLLSNSYTRPGWQNLPHPSQLEEVPPATDFRQVS